MLGFSPLASAPLADDGAVVVNVSLTADSITTGAPQIGDLFSYDDYEATASGLFDSTSSTNVDLYTNNRGFSIGGAGGNTGYVAQNPAGVYNLTVNSTGISFRLYGSVIASSSTNQWTSTTNIHYTDVTLNWSGTTVVTTSNNGTFTASSNLPATTYLLGTTALDDAIASAAATAGVSSNLYDWIPDEVTVTESSDVFRARLAGSSTDLDTYSFSQNSSTVYLYGHYVVAGRFLILTQYPNQNDSAFSNTNASANPDTEITVARFTRSVQPRYAYEVSHAQDYNLTPTDVVAAAPTVDASSVSHDYNLTATEITAAAPTVDASTLTEDGVFTGVDITAGAPTVDASTITQVHDLTATEITAGAPTVDTPAITEDYALTGVEITTGSPTVDASSITQLHNIGFSGDIVSGAPTVDASSITQVHNISPTAIDAATPTIDASDITQAHDLTATEITAGAPVVDAPTIAGVSELTASEITTGASSVDAHAASQYHAC